MSRSTTLYRGFSNTYPKVIHKARPVPAGPGSGYQSQGDGVSESQERWIRVTPKKKDAKNVYKSVA